MNLKTYFQDNRQVDMASALGVTPGAVNQWMSGEVVLSAERCIQIEEFTKGAVKCEELRPDIKWNVLRKRAKSAPATATAGA